MHVSLRGYTWSVEARGLPDLLLHLELVNQLVRLTSKCPVSHFSAFSIHFRPILHLALLGTRNLTQLYSKHFSPTELFY